MQQRTSQDQQPQLTREWVGGLRKMIKTKLRHMAVVQRSCGACSGALWEGRNMPAAFWRLGEEAVGADEVKCCFCLVFLKVITIFPVDIGKHRQSVMQPHRSLQSFKIVVIAVMLYSGKYSSLYSTVFCGSPVQFI